MKFAAGTRDSITNRPYFFRSDCGRYTVGIPFHDEPYSAWLASVPQPELKRTVPAVFLGQFPTSKAAREACEAHASAGK